MHLPSSSAILSSLLLSLAAGPSTVLAWLPPSYSGYNLVWYDAFYGSGGSGVSSTNWNIITNLNVNNEWQRYTTDRANLQISGGETVQIVPWKNSGTGEWTSARIESKYTFTPASGKLTLGEARLRFGDNAIANKKGLWPAFWLLGDSIRHGTGWPACGEIDAMETVNGALTGYGTAHCGTYPGGVCNEPNGIGGTTSIPDQGWHNWRVQWDRRSGNWASETITWFLDGRQFHQVSGSRVGSESVWNSMAHNPLFFILNMAVGGNFPGNPNDSTLGGYGSMLEVAYVAHYVST